MYPLKYKKRIKNEKTKIFFKPLRQRQHRYLVLRTTTTGDKRLRTTIVHFVIQNKYFSFI